jgi:hypothetical protein
MTIKLCTAEKNKNKTQPRITLESSDGYLWVTRDPGSPRLQGVCWNQMAEKKFRLCVSLRQAEGGEAGGSWPASE